MKSVAIAACALAVLGVQRVAAQGVERIMQAREALALTDDQIASLDAIRREIVQERNAEQAEMAELRSQLEAGQIRRSEVIAAQEDRVAAAEGRAEERQTRVDAVLTEDQLAQVELMRTRADRVRGRRQGVAPGRSGGFGGGARRPGFAPGGRGGFGPGGLGPVGPRGQRGGAGFGGPRGFGPR
jgi:hypothetical protein